MSFNVPLHHSLVPDELLERIERDAESSGGALTELQASAWRGYLAALHESGVLDMAGLTVVLMRIAALYPGSLDDSVFDGLSVPARVRMDGDLADVDMRLARLRQLGFQFADMLDPDLIAPVMMRTLVESLELSYAALFTHHPELAEGEQNRLVTEYAQNSEAPARTIELPLMRRGEQIGLLRVGLSQPEIRLSEGAMQVLRDFAARSGPAIYIVRALGELRRTGEQMVFAREEERRLLRRNLHDSIGPTLAALNLRSSTIRRLLEKDPKAADEQLAELRGQIRMVIAEIRRVVHNLRPPALDELGLLSAIHELARQFTVAELTVLVDAPDRLPQLNAAAEVAAYRIVSEGLANVVRHAQAHNCWIRLQLDSEMLHVEILDDGVGMDHKKGLGVGLMSMRQRALELGGRCQFQSAPSQGTLVRASLPLRSSADAQLAHAMLREPHTVEELSGAVAPDSDTTTNT
jgi:signal transduction histidine kinase